MSKNKKKVRKLTDEQYKAYIGALKDDAALYDADGTQVIPDEYKKPEKKKENGD